MSHLPADLPERLLAGDATDFERRVLAAALEKKPSPAASARMARALGVTAAATVGTVAAAKALAADAAASQATAAAAATTAWPWVSVGVLGLVVAGAVVGTRAWRAPPPERRQISDTQISDATTAPRLPAERPSAPTQPTAEVVEPLRNPVVPARRRRTGTAAADLRDQIALIDAARAAVAADSDRGALEILRRYQDRYPTGTLRPEATALKVEVLIKLGRDAEARALAERFVAEHRGSLLAARVAAIAGLTAP